MGLHFKILDGNTPRSGKPLCLSCANMSRRIGQNLEDQIVCSSYKFQGDMTGPSVVPFRVAECTEYHPFNTQSLKDMYSMAWIIQARKRGPPGFAPDEGVKAVNQQGEETIIEIKPPSKRKHEDDDEEDFNGRTEEGFWGSVQRFGRRMASYARRSSRS